MSSIEHAWLDAIPEPAALVDGRGVVIAQNAASRAVFGVLRSLRDVVAGSRRDLDATTTAVTRPRFEGVERVAVEDRQGREWTFQLEANGAGRALVRFQFGVDDGTDEANLPDVDDDDEPTAEIVRLGRPSARAMQGAVADVIRRSGAEVVSFRARPGTTTSLYGREPAPPTPPPEVLEDEDDEADLPTVAVNMADMARGPRLPRHLVDLGAPVLLVRDGRVIDANPMAASFLGYRLADTLVGRRLVDFAPDTLASGESAVAVSSKAVEEAQRVGRHVFSWTFRRDREDVRVDATLSGLDEQVVPAGAARAWVMTWRSVAAPPDGDRSRERLALALARSIRPLLVRDEVDGAIVEALGTMGTAIGADRCFMVTIDEQRDGGRVHNRQRFAWAAEGVPALPDAARVPGPERGVVPPRWLKVLSSGGVLVGDVAAFPQDERAVLGRYEVRSLAVVPVRADGRLLGFLGLDACRAEREWTTTEIEILRGMADSLAGAFKRRDADRALQHGRDRYEAAVRGAALGLWELDVQVGRLVHVDGVERVLGVSRDLIPRTLEGFADLVHPDDRDRVRTAATEHAAGRTEMLDVETRLRGQGREAKWVLLRGRITERDGTGRPLRAHGTLLDIDEQKRLLEEVRAARVVAEQASEAKSRFLANMSHEIRTPLNAVLGMATLLRTTRLSDKQLDLVDTLKLSGEHLLALLNQILDISQIEAGRLELASAPFDLRALLLEVRDLFRPLAERRGLGLELRVDEKLPLRVQGDPLRLKQVLVNLVDNAVKFTESGGVTVVAWCPDHADPLRVRLEVSDTGVGMPPDAIGTLFDAFAQADGSDARRHQGSGLGLAISRHLCDLMGSGLQAESVPGRGSVFRFDVTFLAAPIKERPQDADPEEDTLLPGDLKILVVEDNLVNQKVAVGMLERLGCRARVTDSGAEALATVAVEPPDVVLMDIQMPDMDGLETTRRIRDRLGSDTWPWIIAVTAAAQSDDRARSFACGMNDYLVKPVRLQDLRRALSQAVERLRAS